MDKTTSPIQPRQVDDGQKQQEPNDDSFEKVICDLEKSARFAQTVVTFVVAILVILLFLNRSDASAGEPKDKGGDSNEKRTLIA